MNSKKYKSSVNVTINNKKYKLGKSKLGSGSFGEIIKCKKNSYNNRYSNTYACKLMKSPKKQIELFNDEYKLMKKIGSHRNIVKLVDIYNQSPYVIVLEYCKYGSLLNQLIKRYNKKPNILYNFKTQRGKTNYSILNDICNGLSHLHKKNIIHRDLSARNILLHSNKNAKISDFGLSKKLNDTALYYIDENRDKLAIKWMPPEVICKIFYKSSDIWSLGNIIYEIANNGTEPYFDIEFQDYKKSIKTIEKKCNLCSNPSFNKLCIDENQSLVDNLLEEINAPTEIQLLMKQCFLINSFKRPTINMIKKYLKIYNINQIWLGS